MSFRFGRFVLDPETRQLTREGNEIHLSPKAFQLLSILITERPRAVSKSELQDQLWPATFVEETNVAGLVAEIRRALDDSATDPEFLRTVYRFGYRFVGTIQESGEPTRATSVGPRPSLAFADRRTLLLEGVNVIGRAPDATVHCDATGVSRHHARIVLSNGEATLEDLGSKNGTYVQGNRVTTARLADGDEIRLGTASLTFRFEPPVAATETLLPDRGNDSNRH